MQSTTAEILAGLDGWIELLGHPAAQQKQWVNDLRNRRTRIAADERSIPSLLVDGNIWGGMGSFLDCAMLDYSHLRPMSSEPSLRAREWELAHQQADTWRRKWNAVTIQLGSALLAWMSVNGSIPDYQKTMIGRWIGLAKDFNAAAYRPLKPQNIENLERNTGG